MKNIVTVLSLFCLTVPALANEEVSKIENVQGILVDTREISSGSLVVCAKGTYMEAVQTELTSKLAQKVIEIRSSASPSSQIVYRIAKPFKGVSAPSISLAAQGYVTAICVTVTK